MTEQFGNSFFDDAMQDKKEGSSGGSRTRLPATKNLLAVVKTWEVVEGKYGRQLSVKMDFPEHLTSTRYFSSETAYFDFPDPEKSEAQNKARGYALAGLIKGLKLSVKNGLDGVGNPSPNPVGLAFRVDKEVGEKWTNWKNVKLESSQQAAPVQGEVAPDDEIPF